MEATFAREGFLAGAIGRLAGSAAKAAAESLYPSRIEGPPEPPVVLAEKVAGRQLDPQLNPDQKKRISPAQGDAVSALVSWP